MQKSAHLPREKLKAKGASTLSDVELLQAIIGSGGAGNDYKAIARNLYSVISKVQPDNLTYNDISAIKGIGSAKATVVFAALEFWRRRLTKSKSPIIDSPEKAAQLLGDIKNKKQEHFVLLTLDGGRRLINSHVVTIGTLLASLVHPREVFALAIEDRAASIIIGHNHPSGVLSISDSDREVTSRIRQAGEIIGIALDDHIIVSGDEYISAF